MRILWMCDMVLEDPTRPNRYVPRLNIVRNGPTGYFPMVWTNTDALRAAPYAVGAADVDAAQLLAIQADGNIHYWDESEWTQQKRDLPAHRRTGLDQWADKIGVERPTANEVGRDTITRTRQIVDNRTADDLLEDLGRI